jgi:hypothetical protein
MFRLPLRPVHRIRAFPGLRLHKGIHSDDACIKLQKSTLISAVKRMPERYLLCHQHAGVHKAPSQQSRRENGSLYAFRHDVRRLISPWQSSVKPSEGPMCCRVRYGARGLVFSISRPSDEITAGWTQPCAGILDQGTAHRSAPSEHGSISSSNSPCSVHKGQSDPPDT